MFVRSLFLALTGICLINEIQASNVPIPQEVLRKFLQLVENYNLNVSIVTSRAKHWTNGNVQDVRANELLLNPNNARLTESKLNFKVGKKWVSDLKDWASENNGVATYRSIAVGSDGKTKTLRKSEGNKIPQSVSYDNILKPNRNDFNTVADKNWTHRIEYQITFPNSSEYEVVNVIARNIQVYIINKSETIAQTEIDKIKQILVKVWYLMDDSDLVAKYLAEYVNIELPSDQFTWRVLIGTGGDTFFHDNKWVILQIANTKIVIFAL